MSTWNCSICNVNLKPNSKYGHLKSKQHKTREKDILESKAEPCAICFDDSCNAFKNCIRCNQKWCIECDKNIFECPYCRNLIDGRQESLQNQKRENTEWQLNNGAFVPQNLELNVLEIAMFEFIQILIRRQ